MRAFGFRLMQHFTFHVFLFFFFFFFSLRVNINLTWVTVHHCSYTVHVLKNIKNGSHDTIYTFKNYFATVLSVFSFQFSVFSNNKLNLNGPILLPTCFTEFTVLLLISSVSYKKVGALLVFLLSIVEVSCFIFYCRVSTVTRFF